MALQGVKGFVVDDIHVYSMRLVASLTFMFGLEFLTALSYESDEDKKNLFYGDLVVRVFSGSLPQTVSKLW